MCNGKTSSLTLGDRLVLNAGGAAPQHLPLTRADLEKEGWVRGSGFDMMGEHWMLDVSSPSQLSFDANKLFPVVLMIDPAGVIASTFFVVPFGQFLVSFGLHH